MFISNFCPRSDLNGTNFNWFLNTDVKYKSKRCRVCISSRFKCTNKKDHVSVSGQASINALSTRIRIRLKMQIFFSVFENTYTFMIALSNGFCQSTRVRRHGLKTITAYLGSQVTSPSTGPSWSNPKFLRSCLFSSSVKTFKIGLWDRGERNLTM